MLKITGKQIELTRGDTAFITLIPKIKTYGIPRQLLETDTIIFRLLTRQTLVEIPCVIDLENNKALLTIEKEDTENITPGNYRYEVELITNNDQHFTFIADQPFILGKELEVHGS